MNSDEKRELENQLMTMGLTRLSDPNLIPQMAQIINNCVNYRMDRHEFFGGLLSACDADKRRAMYDAIRPHLAFEPLGLDTYINRVKERSAAAESKSEPIQVGENKYEIVAASDSEGAVIDFRCHLCGRSASFFGETPVSAIILGRQDGWAHDDSLNKEVCPKCPSETRGKRRECPGCGRRHFAPDCRVIAKLESLTPVDEQQQRIDEMFTKAVDGTVN